MIVLDASPVRLNLGSGEYPIPGFINVDHKNGGEVYPLVLPGGLTVKNESVDDIRASHVLEHLSFGDAVLALGEWHRVLKPGGRLRVAVPDAVKVFAAMTAGDELWAFYAMGGQNDADDFHRSFFNEKSLRRFIEGAGFVDVSPWASDGADTSCHKVSLNLEAKKPG